MYRKIKRSYQYFSYSLFILLILPKIVVSDPRDISGSYISTQDRYIPGVEGQDIAFNFHLASSDYENADYFNLTFPTGFAINYGSDCDGENPTVNGNTISWGQNTNDGYGWWWAPNDYSFSVNVNIDAATSGNKLISYHISGDQYTGTGTPHDIYSSLTIQQALPDLTIQSVSYTNSAEIGMGLNVTVTIENQGSVDAGEFETEIFYDRSSPPTIGNNGDATITTWSLSAGTTTDISFYIMGIDPAIWNMWFIVDNGCAIDEEDESNSSNRWGPSQMFWYEPEVTSNYGWPFYYETQSYNVNSVLNEYRTTYFHAGIDIQASDGTNVYSVSSGIIITTNYGKRIGNFVYRHIDNYTNNLGTDGTWVVAKHLYIADTDGNNHLHFEDGPSGEEINPLRVTGISPPYVDNMSPEIGQLTVYRAGTEEELLLSDPMSGQVDLVIQAKDQIWTSTLRNGIKRISYAIGSISIDSYDFSIKKIGSNYINNVYPQAPEPLSGTQWIYYQITNYLDNNNNVVVSYLDLDTANLLPGDNTLTVSVEDFNGNSVSEPFTINYQPSAFDISGINIEIGE